VAFYAVPKTYAPLLSASGFGPVGKAVRDAFEKRDFTRMAAAVPDEMVDAMAAAGTAADVQARLERAAETFDHVVVYPPSFGLSPERCDELAGALVEQLAPSAPTRYG
jgi:alkanesulfonate monooxygenase SsuD/methylene tetrahydromethanopterin reductase-like flavin-dependent oxidoreductase (luciferase family)